MPTCKTRQNSKCSLITVTIFFFISLCTSFLPNIYNQYMWNTNQNIHSAESNVGGGSMKCMCVQVHNVASLFMFQLSITL